MDSLLASYASSDDEEQQDQQDNQNPPIKPPIKPNPNPKQTQSSSLLFSKLPQPKTQPKSDPLSLNNNLKKNKKVVYFQTPFTTNNNLDEEDDDEIITKKNIDVVPVAPTVKSFLSSIPAPKNSGGLGSGVSGSGMGRKSVLDADVPSLSSLGKSEGSDNKTSDSKLQYDDSENAGVVNPDYANYDYSGYVGGYGNEGDAGFSGYGPVAPGSGEYGSYSGYEGYDGYGPAAPSSDYGYENKWVDRSGGNVVGASVDVAEVVQNVTRVPGKRGRNEIPQEVIEVSQDELMKNRPREDQVKATGIAFGPAYQPTSSTKGKPTKLHKRKHQIGSLYFDMRSKEMELAERRSKGFLTKAETHAKYGW